MDKDSILYEGPFTLNNDAVIKAIAVKDGLESSSLSKNSYTVKAGDAEVSPLKTDYIINSGDPQVFTLTPNGQKLEKIKESKEAAEEGEGYVLVEDTDYTITEKEDKYKIEISSQYLDKKGSEEISLMFIMDGGESPKIIINMHRYGDITGDGSVDVSDAILILRHIVGLEELKGLPLARAKVSNDEALSVADAILILRYIVGLITEFPAEIQS